MRVLQINATYANGSTGTIVKDIQECCIQHGIECHVAYAFSSVPEDKVPFDYKMGNYLSNNLHAVLCRISGKQGYFSYFSTLRLLKYIDKLQPDVVHLHNLHSNYIHLNTLLKYLAEKDIATVVTLHDCWFYTGGCFHYTHAKCSKWTESCGDCPKQKQDTPAYLWDSSAQILKDRYKYFGAIKRLAVIGVSQWITNEAQRSVFKGRDCRTIYNGVDLNIFKPTPSDLRERYGVQDKFVILGPASKWLSPINQDFKEDFLKRIPSDWVLFLFGCPANVQSQPSNVITYGFTRNKEELAQIYTMADVFVNCTHEESMSLINVEAQACGTPVITFDNTGASETVDGESDFRVDNDNIKNVLDLINQIHNEKDNKLYIRIKRVGDMYNKDLNYLKYIELYHSF